jgi:hypothetical protein
MQMAFGMQSSPIQQKINEQHITKALDLAGQSQTNEYRLGIWDRICQMLVLAVVIAVGVYLIQTFKDKPNLLGPVLSAFGGFVAGAASGFGIGRAVSRNGR